MAKLRAAECRKFIDAVIEKAAQMGVPVSVAVVGPEGHIIAVERMDEAGFITPETAIAKAFTVAAFRSMSPRFPDGLVIQQWFKERNPQLLVSLAAMTNGRIAASGGAAPVFKGDEMVGAYGVSGGTSQQDEIMANYAREKVGWAHTSAEDPPAEVKAHINEFYAKAGIKERL
jgi:uncharacterized protein GlcG (DUF336 family)